MYGGADKGKRARVRRLFRDYAQPGRALLSTQVAQEFYAAGSRKLDIPRRELRTAAAALLEFPVIPAGPAHITAAIETEERYGISFWDALIVAAAQSEGADILFTKDLNDGQQYGTVTVLNPFRAPKTGQT